MVSALVTLAAGCMANASHDPTEQTSNPITINSIDGSATPYDPCVPANPDSWFTVPTTYDPDAPVLHSAANGGYGYRGGCNAYIVDIQLAWNSNTGTGEGQPALTWWGGAVNLPSATVGFYVDTAGAHPEVPANPTDCAHHVEQVTMYEADVGGAFSFVYGESHQGQWVNGACKLNITSLTGAPKPEMTYPAEGAPNRVYRFAVQTQLRTSFQQTGLWFWEVQNFGG
jgi:hypothetical protein